MPPILIHSYSVIEMLGFTHEPRKLPSFRLEAPQFQPIIITNRLPIEVSPKKTQKNIIRTHAQTNSNPIRPHSASLKNAHNDQQSFKKKEDQWKDARSNAYVIDSYKQLRKNELAEEERRIRAAEKIQKKEALREVVEKGKEIKSKTIVIQKEKDKQIEKLRSLIDNEKKEKDRNDRLYQEKLREIEEERRGLVELERRIQREGVRHGKEIKRQVRALHESEYPSNDRAKCHQEIRQTKEKPQEEITQSELISQQKHVIRQQQLELLTQQRERCLKAPGLAYAPTLIPLLSKASYRIISTHVSTLVELFIDDLMEEQVYLMEKMELEERREKERHKKKDLVRDYCQQLGQFVDEADQIEHRAGRYSTMKFEDLYIPKHYPAYQKKHQFSYDDGQVRELHLNLEEEAVEELESKKERFIRFVGNFDEYKKSNLLTFERTTEEIINEAIEKLAKELDKGSGEFVDLVFRNEIK